MRGDRLRAFAARLFDAQTMSRVIDPAIADLQREPFTAGQYVAVLKTIALCIPEISVRGGTAVMLSSVSALAVMALLEIPFLFQAWKQGGFDARMVGYLAPQAVSFATAIGFTIWILGRFGGRVVPAKTALCVTAVAAIICAGAFVMHGWVTPEANQAFRTVFVQRLGYAAPPVRSFPEMSIGEVREQFAAATRSPGLLNTRDLHYLAVSYQGRIAASVAPLVFALFALVLTRARPGRRWGTALVVCVSYIGYLLYLTEPRLVALDGPWLGGAAWYPELALVAIAVVMMAVNRREAHVAAG